MLSYHLSGKGRTVVLLHAFPLSSRMWEPDAARLEKKFRVLTPDFPGFGASEIQPGISIEGMAAEVKKLLEALAISEPVFLAGLSMGGYAAFEFLRQFPNAAAGLGLFSTRASADTDAARENRFKSIEAMERFGIAPFAKKAVKSQLGETSQKQNPELIEKTVSLMCENTAQAAIEAQKAMASRRDSTAFLSQIKIPVLVLAGEEDMLSPPSEMEKMHAMIPGSEFHVIPKAGHLIQWENPECFYQHLESFLNRTFAS